MDREHGKRRLRLGKSERLTWWQFPTASGQPVQGSLLSVLQTATLRSGIRCQRTVRTLMTSGDGLFIGGSFATVAGQPRRGAAVLDGVSATGELLDWDPNLAGSVKTLFPFGSETVIGGSFSSVRGVFRANLALVGPGIRTTDARIVPIGGFALGPVTPNPVRGTAARVMIHTGEVIPISLDLFDVAGRRARRIMNEASLAAGDHEARISSTGLQPGVYFLRLDTGNQVATRKVLMSQ